MKIDMNALVEKIQVLMDIPSISGNEKEVGEKVCSLFDSMGFKAEKNWVGENRFNVVAGELQADVMFCTHMDTVPPFIPFRRENGTIFGRGSCDAKGILISMMEAGRVLRDDHGIKVSFLFVVSEETDHLGAQVARKKLPHRADFLMVGEPTEGVFANGQKGALKCTLKFKGKACHSAYPEQGHSAILDLLEALHKVSKAPWGKHESLGEGTVNIGQIRGGVAHNVVPPAAEADLLFRLVESSSRTMSRLKELLGGRGEISVDVTNEPVTLYVPPGEKGKPVAFNTDVPYLEGMGTPMLMGPGSILDAHTEQERVQIDQLEQACQKYVGVILQLVENQKSGGEPPL